MAESGGSELLEEVGSENGPGRESAGAGWSRRKAYLITAGAALVLSGAVLRPWEYWDAYPPVGGDGLWTQAMVTMFGQAGPFGVTEHLAFPTGASPWSLPQLGMLIGFLAWAGVGLIGLPPAVFLHSFVIIAAVMNSVAIVYFLRGLVGSVMSWLAVSLGVILGTSLWILANAAVTNLPLFAIVPAALGLLARWARSDRRYRIAGVVVITLLALVSPAWWVVVAALMLPWMVLAPLLRSRWSEAAGVVITLAGIAAGLAVQFALQSVAAGSMSDFARSRWDSQIAAGTLLDILHASPAVNALIPVLNELAGGTSLWAYWGFSAAVMAAVALVAVVAVAGAGRPFRQAASTLASASVVSVLYLLSGGLGHLQAGIAVLLGTESPARWWSRMMLIMAVAGAGWLMVGFRTWWRAREPRSRGPVRWSALVLVGVLAAGWAMDHIFDPRPGSSYRIPPPAGPAVDMITARTDPCPVAQFPSDPIPTSKVEHPFFGDTLYADLLPYVLEPDYYWSAGSDDPVVAGVPEQLTKKTMDDLGRSGFCAVLYSRALGELAVEQDVGLPGSRVADGLRPDYSDDRFQVFLLDGTGR